MSTCLRLVWMFWIGSASALIPFAPRKSLSRVPLEVSYWAKPSLARQMREDRSILVSVQTKAKSDKKIQLDLRGAGLVHLSLDQTFARATDFSHIRDWSLAIK